MRYSERELRAVDVLALVLVGFGFAVAGLGTLLHHGRWFGGGMVLAGLGFVLNTKLRRILRNGDREDSVGGKRLFPPEGGLEA